MRVATALDSLDFLFGGGVGESTAPRDTGPRGTTNFRHGERGANTPEGRSNGTLGGGMIDEIRARKCSGASTRCVAPLRRGLRRR
jgi:hypothetical protein